MNSGGVRVGFLSVFGHTNIDYLAKVPQVPGPDQSVPFTGLTRSLGGTAANVAAWAAALGAPSRLASMVGPDFPPEYAAALRKLGVDLRGVKRIRGSTTPVCWIFSDPHEHQACFINQGAAVDGASGPVDAASIRAAQIVHIGTGPSDYHTRVAAAASRAGRQVAFDPGQELSYSWTPTTFRKILRHVDLLFLNDAERLRARRYLRASSDRALLASVPAVVITHGKRGAELLSGSEHVRAPAVRADRVVNTTGAGDAFRGGFYSAKARRLPAAEQLHWGAAAASLAVETSGTQPPPRARRRHEARVKRIRA